MRDVFAAALLLATLGAPVRAQPVAPAPAPALLLDHVGIQVADVERSVAFYARVLGLREVPAPFPRDAARWFALGGGRMLHIVAHGTPGAPHNRWDHYALACADFDAMVMRLDELHVAWKDMDGHHAIQTRPDRIRQIFVRDPDGYVIEINDAHPTV
ncbi:VOC family protein [Sphingomonas sp. CD22]|uniref:VOC family protein n=1 Tax=Sphingomonas sp. CD22 TaxID=3100214 RepID=UPI002AE04BF0|nr:VOC family protein [Sphingomonas sp. CD22]MEA1084992.1 VOC family protein [Sphingomonas sp. CD22]